MAMITHYHRTWAAPNRVQNEFMPIFDRFLGDGAPAVPNQWMPRVDIREEDKGFVILADVPGIDPASIEVQMDKNILSIRGERMAESEGQQGEFTRVERSHGVFYRHFVLPDSADAEGISATGRHGVLEITIPKRPETTPRRIRIASE